MIDSTTVINLLPIIIAGLGGYVLGIKKWWGNKSTEQKKDAVKDAIDALKDGKITPDEIKSMIDEHF